MSDLAAGYYRYLAQAVGALAQNTPEARAVLYQQVRGAVAHRLETAQPPHSDAEIARHKAALERVDPSRRIVGGLLSLPGKGRRRSRAQHAGGARRALPARPNIA